MARRTFGWLAPVLLLTAAFSLRCGGDEGSGPGDSAGSSGESGSPGAGRGGSAGSANAASGGEGGLGAPDPVCSPGDTRVCVGPGACSGGQACLANGTGFGACDCGSGMGGGAGNDGGSTGGQAFAGEAGGPAGGGESGAAGAGGASTCDPIQQTGCEAGEKCTSMEIAEEPFEKIVCAPDGIHDVDASCSAGGSIDTCRAGSYCASGGMGDDRCLEICDTNEPTSCDGSCVLYEGLFDGTGAGLCHPLCDLLTQDCPAETMCIFTTTSSPFCAGGTSDPTALGEACMYANECDTGLACAIESVGETAKSCAYLCEASGSAGQRCDDVGGPGGDSVCVPLTSLYEEDHETGSAGVCLSCASAGIENCALMQPGGCSMPSDCDPLGRELGEEFDCDLGTDSCVLL